MTAGLVLALAAAVGASACAPDDPPPLSPQGARGQMVAIQQGCATCHGAAGEGSPLGPAFAGLAGSTVELADGTTVVADEAYLRRAIVEPGAQRTAGEWPMPMSVIPLDQEQVDALVAYIEELSGGT
jgi:cytochrome c oxidase subunit 2